MSEWVSDGLLPHGHTDSKPSKSVWQGQLSARCFIPSLFHPQPAFSGYLRPRDTLRFRWRLFTVAAGHGCRGLLCAGTCFDQTRIEKKVLGELLGRHLQLCWSGSAWGPKVKQDGIVIGVCLWSSGWFALKLGFRVWGTGLVLSLKGTDKHNLPETFEKQ